MRRPVEKIRITPSTGNVFRDVGFASREAEHLRIRADLMKESYGYDIEPFYAQLRKRGFVIPAKSMSNYSQTCMSLSSALNLDYIDDWIREVGEDSQDRSGLRRMLVNSLVWQLLKTYGYQQIAFATGYTATIVAGKVTRRGGADTGARPGRLVRASHR